MDGSRVTDLGAHFMVYRVKLSSHTTLTSLSMYTVHDDIIDTLYFSDLIIPRSSVLDTPKYLSQTWSLSDGVPIYEVYMVGRKRKVTVYSQLSCVVLQFNFQFSYLPCCLVVLHFLVQV